MMAAVLKRSSHKTSRKNSAGVDIKMTRELRMSFISLITSWVVLGALSTPFSAAAPGRAPHAQAGRRSGTGAITGIIRFQGNKPALQQIYMNKDPECVRENQGRKVYTQDGAVNANGTLPYVFVYIKSGALKASYPPPKKPVILDQQGCIFVPHVLGIMVGQSLKVLNSDFTTHNVHVEPKNNPAWNQSQPPGAAPFEKKFAHRETMITAKCNMHPWMRAYIGVVSNPYYDVTGPGGNFSLNKLPAGEYTLEAWTATFGTQEKTVTVRPGETARIEFTFGKP